VRYAALASIYPEPVTGETLPRWHRKERQSGEGCRVTGDIYSPIFDATMPQMGYGAGGRTRLGERRQLRCENTRKVKASHGGHGGHRGGFGRRRAHRGRYSGFRPTGSDHRARSPDQCQCRHPFRVFSHRCRRRHVKAATSIGRLNDSGVIP
jgi:hypothetical protein